MTIKKSVLMGEAMLGFVFGKLKVSYRGSDKPQKLVIDAKYDESVARQGQLDGLVEAVNRLGLGGGEHFHPKAGKLKPLKGDFGYTLKQPLNPRKVLRAEMQLSGVSPKFIRRIVEGLRVGCLEMKIVGELEPDGSPLSCTERDIQKWVPHGDLASNPGLWEPLELEVEEGVAKKGAEIRIQFADALDPVTCTKKAGLDWRMVALGGELAGLLDTEETRAGSVSIMPTLERGRAELAATYRVFNVAREPARALVLNAVTRIHHSVQPVKRVTFNRA